MPSQQDWNLDQDAQHIRHYKQAGAPKTHHVFYAGRDAWVMLPQSSEVGQALKRMSTVASRNWIWNWHREW